MPQDPEKVRSVFDGWFEDNTFVTEFDFDSPIVADTSMIAKWVEDDTLLIGTNIYTFNDNFMFGLVKPELERYAGEREVEIEIVNSEYDQSLLNDQVDAFIESGVDVLAINLVDISAARTIINKAKAADIPLIFFSKEPSINDMATYDKVWYVGVNDNEAGTKQGEMIVADWQANTDWDLNDDGVIDYVLLKGESGHPVAEARTLESIKALTDAGYTVNELALAASPYWSTADAKNTMEAWLTSAFADQIEVVICNNDGLAFGAIQALDAADKALPVYGVDALEFTLELIGAGDMAGTVLLDGEGIARTVIDLAINAAQGNDVLVGTNYILDGPLTKAVRVPFVIINRDNYEDYLE
jgi:methyl-galactoside transport system substrate-binding protein